MSNSLRLQAIPLDPITPDDRGSGTRCKLAEVWHRIRVRLSLGVSILFRFVYAARLVRGVSLGCMKTLLAKKSWGVDFGPASSGVTQKRPMRVTSKPANENEARGR